MTDNKTRTNFHGLINSHNKDRIPIQTSVPLPIHPRGPSFNSTVTRPENRCAKIRGHRGAVSRVMRPFFTDAESRSAKGSAVS